MDRRLLEFAAWPSIVNGDHTLLVSPTGTERPSRRFWRFSTACFESTPTGTLQPGLRCVYVSPLKSLGYDVDRNLTEPLDAIRRDLHAIIRPCKSACERETRQFIRGEGSSRPTSAFADHDAGKPIALAQSKRVEYGLAIG